MSPSRFTVVCRSVTNDYGMKFTAKEMGVEIAALNAPLHINLVLEPGMMVGYNSETRGWARAKIVVSSLEIKGEPQKNVFVFFKCNGRAIVERGGGVKAVPLRKN